ncbi:MAG: hypothetical protein OER86_09685 [Phycisphaerae bacterium]|nr:hypothetical protein [Phycisphaerae bacterium]
MSEGEDGSGVGPILAIVVVGLVLVGGGAFVFMNFLHQDAAHSHMHAVPAVPPPAATSVTSPATAPAGVSPPPVEPEPAEVPEEAAP